MLKVWGGLGNGIWISIGHGNGNEIGWLSQLTLALKSAQRFRFQLFITLSGAFYAAASAALCSLFKQNQSKSIALHLENRDVNQWAGDGDGGGSDQPTRDYQRLKGPRRGDNKVVCPLEIKASCAK